MSGFIFDLDGTLADTIPYVLVTARKAFRLMGVELTDEQLLAFPGVPLLKMGQDVFGEEEGPRFVEVYHKFYYEDRFVPPAFPGVPEMLDKLKKAGGHLSICTSKLKGPAHDTVNAIGADHYIDVLIHCESGYGAKPSPEPVLAAVRLLGEKQETCCFIGDSVHDIMAAKAAGITAIGVTWGCATAEQLCGAGADIICDTVDQLTELLLKRI